ncbi:adenosylcobinamide-GDP ribazoletransferase [Bosea thiooxidans]
MKDSRIGSYGALALGLSLLLRASLIAMILDRSGAVAAAAAVLAAAPWSAPRGSSCSRRSRPHAAPARPLRSASRRLSRRGSRWH